MPREGQSGKGDGKGAWRVYWTRARGRAREGPQGK